MSIPGTSTSFDMKNFCECSSSSASSSMSSQQSLSVGADGWMIGEVFAQRILLSSIHPTVDSEQRRGEVIDFIQNLIRGHFQSEVFPFGSVPLKTYLPDGDIDLTAVIDQNHGDSFAIHVFNMLKAHALQIGARVIKDVQFIPAQVKVVKCIVEDIVVDISINQMAGISSLFFLEEVNQIIGRDNMFKRSIILIKAWCYYESRILGATHGLISTYALETLILHIIILFYSSLHGPLAVLNKFLDYYSTFNWDRYCVSVYGPVALASLPEMAVSLAEGDRCSSLLKERLQICVEYFSRSTRAVNMESQPLSRRYLNIIDPIRNNNNLGLSINRGSLLRIRFAFSYGSQKLKEILLSAPEFIGPGLAEFFLNTLKRNGRRRGSDVLVSLSPFVAERRALSNIWSRFGSPLGGLHSGHHFYHYSSLIAALPGPPILASSVQNQSAGVERTSDVEGTSTCMNEPSARKKPQSQGIGTRITDVHRGGRLISRGTGAFIPIVHVEEDMSITQETDTNVSDTVLKENLESQAISETDAEEELKLGGMETNNPDVAQISSEGSKSFDISREEFPPRPCRKMASPIEMHKVVQLNAESAQVLNLSSSRNLVFGDFKLSSPPISQEQKEAAAVIRPFQLNDDKDFPPLG